MNFWHIFDSGSKFEILKPNSSWLTFGISKFISLSISHFLFLFLQLFLHCAVIYQQCAIILAITSQNYYHFGHYISKLLSFRLLHLKITIISAITSQTHHFQLSHLKITTLLAIPPQNLFLSCCIKLNIDTNCHIRHYSCKS